MLPTAIIDSDHREIMEHALKTVGDSKDPIERATRLYYAVRDGIWYDPYYPFYRPEHYRASHILKGGRGYCVCKASLLCALGRASRIPSRLGFANVRNHLATRQLNLTDKVGKVNRAQLEEIATTKMPDLTAADMDAAVRTIAGTTRSMGIDVEGVN